MPLLRPFLFLLLASPALLTSLGSSLQTRGERSPRDVGQPIKVKISEGCVQAGDSSDASQSGGKELDLEPGSPLVLTHRIWLTPASGSGSCGCEADFAALRARIEGLEREVSELREKCGGPEGGCCTSQQSTGAGCTVRPPECPNECSDQGRCEDGRCVCFPGFSGPDCGVADCSDCGDKGKCVDGQCVCDAGFTGPDCSTEACPGNCSNRGTCVDGKCVCDAGFTGDDCSSESCPGNCHNKGRCVNGKCVCNAGFAGADCSSKACPGNCSNKGRCVNGKCVCNAGFTGADCSSKSCPGNCHNKGKCVDGKCACNPGFTGPDCSTKACPGNCNNKGKCVNGKCVCDAGFTGPDCSGKSCPGDCGDKGRCVDGKCACDVGFTGPDCSSKSCPGDCSNKGRCVDGKCVCDVGFAGPDCVAKSCPNNCSNKGRCVRGRCVCRRGFTGPDCGECEAGLTGADCSTAMTGVSKLSTKDISEDSVTLTWTQPPVQYDNYYIIITSKKESEQIRTQVAGGLTSYVQSGLAPGQEYTATVQGEVGGRKGAESAAEFHTLISGPKNLRVVKTTTTSVVVQWEQSQGDIDRYRLVVTPNEGGGSQELSLPPERDSAQIDGLAPGRLYDITLVAEKGRSKSTPATVQATPGPEPPTNLVFSEVTENSLTVSWTRPKSAVSGFKVTYTHTQDGEPVSVAVSSQDSTLGLLKLSPGSRYEVSVISVHGLDESDPVNAFVTTLPDPPTDLRAINVTDARALLLWRPALATVDRYIITYGSGKGPMLTVTVTGNAAEQLLKGLEGRTSYSVSITSQLGDVSSSAASASFTTTAGSGGVLRDLKASQVTPRSALVSWTAPSEAVGSYRLTYLTGGQEMKEVTLDPTVTEYKLTRLHPMSKYTVQLHGERGGRYTPAISTEFTTGTLRFSFPTDCSQELLNGVQESGEVEIFPSGREGVALLVYCDMETDGGGWTVFQRRTNGKTDFYQNRKVYLKGFGELDGEFWLGNNNLHILTSMVPMTLRVDLRAGEESVYAKYSSFTVGRKTFVLKVSGYSGTAGDSMSYHNDCPFTTSDYSPNPFSHTNCAVSYKGGWWYRNCHEANLNGLYGATDMHQGVHWNAWKGKVFSIPFTEMKIRPTAFNPAAQG